LPLDFCSKLTVVSLLWQYLPLDFGSKLTCFTIMTVFAIRFWFKVDCCFTIMSFNGLLYYLIFNNGLGPTALFNRSKIIHMTTVSQRLIKLCIVFKIIVFFIIMLFAQLDVILPPMWKASALFQ